MNSVVIWFDWFGVVCNCALRRVGLFLVMFGLIGL